MIKPIIGIGSDVQSPPGKRERAFIYLTYVDALRRAGAIPVLIPPQPENAAELVSELDGVLLAGGDDCDPALYGEDRHPTVEPMDPRRQSNDVSLAKAARDRGIPVLGICLGVQVMNVAAGGSLVQDIAAQVETEIAHASVPEDRARHDVIIEGGTKLAKILGGMEGGRPVRLGDGGRDVRPPLELNVNSSHHQAIGRVGEGLTVTAHAPDGIIEGLEDPRHPFYVGVQWHPEDMSGEGSASTLFGAFVDAARQHAKEKKKEATETSQGVGR
ncbi:MAG TPA: gamma-glutamyl-gamma-aminobutyrate hydrolase family protein [Thermoanaerobaculia bacterium]|nr:gamma-glutamyl-gamma-aminobutyrate hydrolase family protein [Thermoanaerobaculia bacterium]